MKNRGLKVKLQSNLLNSSDLPTIDYTLLSKIENGLVELTENLFFDLLKETPEWLGTRPFLNRIALWQLLIKNEKIDNEERIKAKRSIVRIAIALTPDSWKGVLSATESDVLHAEYERLVRSFTAFFNSHKMPANESIKALREEYLQYKRYLGGRYDLPQYKTPEALATHVLQREFKVSEEVVHEVIKRHTK